MAQPIGIEARVRELHERAVRELVEAHRKRQDHALILAIRYELEDPIDIGLFEVLRGFPGDDGEELLVTEFSPSAELVILGKLRLVLGSPAQVRAAIERHDPELERVRRGRVVWSEKSKKAKFLRQALGIRDP
jgi:hypothetical protein